MSNVKGNRVVPIRASGLLVLTEQEHSQKQKQIVELYDSFSPVLYKYIRGLGISRDEAEDAMQECFLRLARHLIDGRSDVNLRSWLFQVAHNLSMDLHRDSNHTKAATDPEDDMPADLPDPASNPEGIYLQEEAMRRMHAAMTQLSPKQRSSVLMRAQGLRYLEIASVLNVSESRAIYLVKRGLMRLAVDL